MKKRFKKIYLEITNICNLKCNFCPGNKRPKEEMTLENFRIILEKLENYTDNLYFHLMGEPLVHSKINELIDVASLKYQVNITTNGYLIKKIENNKNIRRINISLQAIKSDEEIDTYLKDIFETVDKLHNQGTTVVYRLWNEQASSSKIIEKIEKHYKINLNGNNKIQDRIYLDREIPFIWPDLNNNYYNEEGSCMGLRSHIGILVNGDIVPCCLDYNGTITLGNILNNDIDTILKDKRVQNMQENFLNNKKCEEFCRHCNFYDRIKSAKKINSATDN